MCAGALAVRSKTGAATGVQAREASKKKALEHYLGHLGAKSWFQKGCQKTLGQGISEPWVRRIGSRRGVKKHWGSEFGNPGSEKLVPNALGGELVPDVCVSGAHPKRGVAHRRPEKSTFDP